MRIVAAKRVTVVENAMFPADLLGDEHAAAVDSFSGRRSYRAGVL